MIQYIPKAAVVAEIERRISLFKAEKSKEDASKIDKISLGARAAALEEILSFLDTLEIKEVNLEEEVKYILNQYYYFPEESIDIPTVIRITAKHFFEVGLKAQKRE